MASELEDRTCPNAAYLWHCEVLTNVSVVAPAAYTRTLGVWQQYFLVLQQLQHKWNICDDDRNEEVSSVSRLFVQRKICTDKPVRYVWTPDCKLFLINVFLRRMKLLQTKLIDKNNLVYNCNTDDGYFHLTSAMVSKLREESYYTNYLLTNPCCLQETYLSWFVWFSFFSSI